MPHIQSLFSFTAQRGAALALTMALIAAVPATAVAAGDNNNYQETNGFCVSFKAPVALGAGQPFNQKVGGTYCQPFKWAAGGHEVDVLTSGAGYTSLYWNWPVKPATYSYVAKTLAAGRAVVTYDRIGSGQSSHPLSTDITLDSDAYVLHQMVSVLRLAGYKHINSIGHSYGTGVVLQEAGQYKDVGDVVATGYLHSPRDPAVATRNYPANQDPQFAGAGLDDGYLTSRPDTRHLSFYSASADPDVIAYDEAHKDIVSRTAFIGYAGQQGTPAASNISNTITVPVLAVAGAEDAIFCTNPAVLDCTNQTAVQAYEAPFYAASSSFTAATVLATGHDIALHPSANDSFNTINNWLKTH